MQATEKSLALTIKQMVGDLAVGSPPIICDNLCTVIYIRQLGRMFGYSLIQRKRAQVWIIWRVCAFQ
jgi:hypothetical protein